MTQSFDCNYLTDKTEQLLVVRDERCHNAWVYEQLMDKGFRRSGNEIYRPHCPGCQSCQSIRVAAGQFAASRSQKRVRNKCRKQFSVTISTEPDQQCYPLYQRYIDLRHHSGSMYPASKEQYQGFLFSKWLDTQFLHIWDHDKLIGVAVTDILPDSLSAIYTFFDPDYQQYSLGTFCILNQIDSCREMNKAYLYLGYQIEGCQKMNYKTKYKPYQRLIRAQWTNFE